MPTPDPNPRFFDLVLICGLRLTGPNFDRWGHTDPQPAAEAS